MARGGTPAIVELERAGVRFRVLAFDPDPGRRDHGRAAAEALGVDGSRVFKTLLAEVDGAATTAIVPVAARLSLKALAAALDGRRATMMDAAAAQRATGYVVGGISPFGQKRRLRTVLDASALELPEILVSGGRRGLEVAIAPVDLVRLLAASTAPIATA